MSQKNPTRCGHGRETCGCSYCEGYADALDAVEAAGGQLEYDSWREAVSTVLAQLGHQQEERLLAGCGAPYNDDVGLSAEQHQELIDDMREGWSGKPNET